MQLQFARLTCGALTLAGLALGCVERPTPTGEAAPLSSAAIVASEEAIEALRAPLGHLSKSVLNLKLPDARGRAVFEAEVNVVDLAAAPEGVGESLLGLGFERRAWPVAASAARLPAKEIALWEDFLATVEFFHHFKFYNVSGSFEGDDLYRTHTGFKGLAQLRTGSLAAVQGTLEVDWKPDSEWLGLGETTWRVAALLTKHFELIEGKEPLFVDVGDLVFGDTDRLRAAASPRDESLVETVLEIRSGAEELEDYIAEVNRENETGTNQAMDSTQVAVVDVDRDGYDDFYFSGAHAPSVFFRSRGDGSFEEISGELGLDLDDVHSAAFADFDNDGDPDAFISFFNRASASRYLVNEDGRFVDRSDTIEGGLPSWVLPIGVTDYNNDGLLDVYLGTYLNSHLPNFVLANERTGRDGGGTADRLPWVDDDVAQEVYRRLRSDGHPISNAPGPPNWLLENQGGGRFRRADGVAAAEVFYNTLATGWTDADRDGDMDLYVVNEGGPNQMLRNDGNGGFADISNADTGEIGFGMGLGVGDYDNDGRSDFYTTNMFSKAGMRIAAQMRSSEIVQQSARGNSLIRNSSSGFTKVSSLDGSGVQVEAADFGWSGGFVDLNNDGFLDLYVPAGMVTIPSEIATVGDS